ncbi:MAG: 1-deoxy-D-xylulose-5-phosphate reductoisomerase, partial [Gammaproteobacteria bacterium]|nr:1-deoxy-D-xylulose-5-phosphate reductoisomerase [Gammaproteobacteria bacterium]
PDMRTPIAHALAWPQRIDSGVADLDMFAVARLDFEVADWQRFPCLRLAYEALERGGTATTVLNAANEIAVDAFLNETIGFLSIPTVIERTLELATIAEISSIEALLACDAEARNIAQALIKDIG